MSYSRGVWYIYGDGKGLCAWHQGRYASVTLAECVESQESAINAILAACGENGVPAEDNGDVESSVAEFVADMAAEERR